MLMNIPDIQMVPTVNKSLIEDKNDALEADHLEYHKR